MNIVEVSNEVALGLAWQVEVFESWLYLVHKVRGTCQTRI